MVSPAVARVRSLETAACLARNRKFESVPLQRRVRLSPDFAFAPGKGLGFPPFWRPCGAAASAETRKA
jgi:hypothetical protein